MPDVSCGTRSLFRLFSWCLRLEGAATLLISSEDARAPLLSVSTGEVIGLVDLGTTQANGIGFAVSTKVAQPLLQAWEDAPQAIPPANCPAQTQSQPTTTSPTTSTPTTTTPAPAPVVATYPGHAFSIEYPYGWTIVSAEQQHSYGTDTTIQDPAEPTALIRVDVSQHVFTTNLRSLAQREINALSTAARLPAHPTRSRHRRRLQRA